MARKMTTPRLILALPLALATLMGSASASEIRDRAGMFSPDAIRKAEATLDRVEQQYRAATIVETTGPLDGQPVDAVARQHAERSGIEGIYVLISKDGKIDVLDSHKFLGNERRRAIMQSFIDEFRQRNFDAGLIAGAQTIERTVGDVGGLKQARSGAPAPAPAPAQARRGSGGGLGVLMIIGLVIVGVLLVTRLFGGNRAGYGPGQMPMQGRPGYGPGMGGPGYGPGYGAPGYGRGGGFFSGLLGGLGGAMAGNWLYVQFRGHNHPGTPTDYTGADASNTGGAEPGGDWGSTSGDWGGSDAGGGGDWGGGGGSDGSWGGGGFTGGGGGSFGGGGASGDW